MRFLEQLEPSALMRRAQQATGLDDFGPKHFVEPLTVLTTAMRTEADLHEAGADAQAARLTNALENRLRRRQLLAQHPEIVDRDVHVGVVIVGLPRTGSTMLHRLLASSPKATALRWWETMFPLPRGRPGEADIAARKADAEALVQKLMSASAGFEAIHPLDAHAHDEELPLIEQSFMSNIPESMLYVPSYGDWLLKADQRPAYDELTEWLKILEWQNPERAGRSWVLKAPHHLTAVSTVLEVFPDAVVAMTHRRIDHVMGSWYSMVSSLTGGNTSTDFAGAQAEHWTRRLHANLIEMMAARRSAEYRFVDVHYKALLNAPLVEAQRIFTAAGLFPDKADEAAFGDWLALNRRDNRPSHKYDVEDFGISIERLKRDFAFYSDIYDPSPPIAGAA